MASRRVEMKHKQAVAKILSSSGLVCVRSPAHSSVSIEEFQETEESVSVEEEYVSSDSSIQEQSFKEDIPDSPEEENIMFPSPSLRRLLPEKVRAIEAQNRIHVLPEEFKKTIDPALIPKINPQVKYIDIIADLVGCTEYKSSLPEFWFLDTMANLLRRAQEDHLPRPTQAVLMLWFCEWMKEIQNFDAADRKRMLRRFKENMLSAARFIAEDPRLPTPDDAGVYYKAVDEVYLSKKDLIKPDDQHVVTFGECAYECAMRDLVQIMHYIFDLFSTDFQFDLVRSIFTFTPEYHLIDMPFSMRNPKQFYTVLKAKKEKPKRDKEVKKDRKGKKEPDTEEYIALMELKAKEEREIEEQETKEAEEWNMRSNILPLAFTATDELFDKYWPPPPPEPVIEVPKEETGKKGKKKK